MPIGSTESPEDYIERMAKRFEQYVPWVSYMLRSARDGFHAGGIVNEPFGLAKIDDMVPDGLLGENCVLTTMAVQSGSLNRHPRLVLDSRLAGQSTVDRKLQTQLSRAVLRAHEYVYLYGREMKHASSDNTRGLVATLLRGNGLTVRQVIDAMVRFGFSSSSYNVRLFYPYQRTLDVLAKLKDYTRPVYSASLDPNWGPSEMMSDMGELDPEPKRKLITLTREIAQKFKNHAIYHLIDVPLCVRHSSANDLSADQYLDCKYAVENTWGWIGTASPETTATCERYFASFDEILVPVYEKLITQYYEKVWAAHLRLIPGLSEKDRQAIDRYMALAIKLIAKKANYWPGGRKIVFPDMPGLIDLNYEIPIVSEQP